jgi:hypothetical protein
MDTRLKEMKEQMREILEAKIKDNSEKFEIPRDALVSRRAAHQESTKACLGKTEARIQTGQEEINAEIKTDMEDVEATDLEANQKKRTP